MWSSQAFIGSGLVEGHSKSKNNTGHRLNISLANEQYQINNKQCNYRKKKRFLCLTAISQLYLGRCGWRVLDPRVFLSLQCGVELNDPGNAALMKGPPGVALSENQAMLEEKLCQINGWVSRIYLYPYTNLKRQANMFWGYWGCFFIRA